MNQRIYSIKVNGINESVDLIDKLIKRLEDLEKRINNLQGKNVSVGGASGGGGSSRSGGADLYDKIEKTQQRINQASEEEYKILLKKKAELKEIEKEQKAIVAGERAEAQEYANTLNGQRQKLADLKAALGNITIGSADFDQQVKAIDELNSKILEIEKSYGQYGRQVGNYANGVAEGMQKVVIKVGETERTFASAKEASRTLGNELKSMAINGEQNTQAYSDLDEAFKKLQSTMKDVETSSQTMDNLLDTMQSFTAIGSIGQGFAALFGFDDSEIQKSIQKLVALQNVLQGLETIQKQITTAEGIGGWIAKGNEMIDSFVQSLTGVKTASDTAATGLKTVAVANTAVETTSKAAAVGTKILSASLKAIGVGLVIAGISALISMIEKFIDESKKEENALKELQEEQNKINVSYKMAKAEITSYRNAVINFVGTKKEEQAMVAQLNSKYGSALGTYKTLGQWKDILIQKTEAYCEAMKLEAEMAAATKRLENAYLAEMEAKNAEAPWWNIFETDESYRILQTNIAKQNRETAEKAVEDLAAKIHSHSQKAGLFDYSPQIKSGSAKSGETIQQQEQELTRLRIRAMDEGLQKVIAEINYNARKEIDALKLTGARKAEAEALIEQERQRKIENAQKEHFQKMLEERKKYEDKIAEMTASNEKREIENNIKENENALNRIKYIPYEAAERKNEEGELVRIFDEIFFLNPDNVDEFLKKNYDEIASVLKETEDFKKLYNEIGLSYDNLLKFVLQKRIENIKELYDSERNTISDLYKQKKDELKFDYDTAEKELNKEIKSLLGTSTQNSILANVTKDFRLIPDKEKLDKAEQEYKEFIAGIKKQISSLSENDTQLYEKLSLQLGGSLGEAYDKGEIGFKEMLERLNAYYEQFKKRSTVELNDYFNNVVKLDLIDNKSSVVSTTVNYYNNLIKEIERQLNATQNRYGQGEQRDAFGIIDLAKTKKLSTETKLTYDNLLKELDQILENAFKADLPNEEFQNLQTTLESLIRKIKELNNEVNNKNQNIFGDFLRSIMPYVSQLANGLQNILGQVSNLISAEFDAQRQALDDELALLEENYNAQEELEQRHADKINAIEDEIANARGARRDRLVDMYNEEIEQQRRAFIEKQKIDEEMRRNEEKQKALEKAERKKQNEIQFQQALMSQALAIMNAFATKPFVPVGIAMGALATTLTAVQLVLMKKAQQASERYADGGIVSGVSHAQGGVKAVVGGQRAIELEGNEFIIRKKTATQNLPLLDYINKSERKLDANDLLNFFKGNQGTKTIRNSFKTKFASGGALPSVSTTKASNTIVVVDNRQPVVQVVDILDATKNYENVRVLAGVES